jgi:hypothetical protein
VWRREKGSVEQKKVLSTWPTTISNDYLKELNRPLTVPEEEALERSEDKSIPYGREGWVSKVVKKYGIEQVLRGVGRPKKGG